MQSNKFTPLLIVALVLFAFVTGSLWTKVKNLEKGGSKTVTASPTPEGQAPEQNVILGEQDKAEILKETVRVKGPENAKVTIVEFSEFQCPYCKQYNDTSYSQIMADYGDKIRYIFRDYPLPMHNHAQEAAEASRCAGEQGKFWEYHDKLFVEQAIWTALATTTESFNNYATTLGLNAGQFSSCLSSGKYKEEVKNDAALGQKVGVSGTPSFFINGRQLVGAQPYEAFKTIIEEELQK